MSQEFLTNGTTSNILTSYIYTIAGTGVAGTGTDGSALSSPLNLIKGIFVDSFQNLYVADAGNHRIRMIPKVTGTNYGISMTPNNIYTIAGTGSAGDGTDGQPINSQLNSPNSICVDSFQNLYIADTANNRIRMIPKVTGTYYGISMTGGYIYIIAGSGIGAKGADGPALTSAIYNPVAICVDSFQNLYISDTNNHRIRMIPKVSGIYYGISMTANNIFTIAGTGSPGYGADGVPLSSALTSPNGIFVDSFQNLYITDSNRIRMIPNVSGTYYSIAMTANNIYTIAGQYPFTSGGTGTDGPPLSSALSNPYGICVDSFQNLYVADFANHRIRMIPKVTGTYYGISMTGEYIYTIAGTGSPGTGADGVPLSSALKTPWGIFVDSLGYLYISDYGNYRIRKMFSYVNIGFGNTGGITSYNYLQQPMLLNYMYTIAGTGFSGKGADGPALTSQLNSPRNTCVDSSQNLYIADEQNNRIRMIPKVTGTYYGILMTGEYIYTIAGTGTAGKGGDGNPLSSLLNNPDGICVDSFQNLYVADKGNNRIRMIPKVTGTYYSIAMTANNIYTIAGTGTAGKGGDGSPLSSELYNPIKIFVDSLGNLYIADTNNQRIRMIPNVSGTYYSISMTANNIYTIAGTGTPGIGVDGTPLSSALNYPNSIAVDSFQNLYISDTINHRIRMIPIVTGTYYGISMTANNIYTIAGTGTAGKGTDGLALYSALSGPCGIFVDSFQNLFIADQNNSRIRMIPKVTGTYYGISMTGGYIYTIAGGNLYDNGPALNSILNTPLSVFGDSIGNLYISDYLNHRIRIIFAGTIATRLIPNNIYTIAGTGSSGKGADGNPLSSALSYPGGIFVDSFQNLYIADSNNSRIRMIPKVTGTYYGISMTANNIYTIAGTGTAGKGADGNPLSSALNNPLIFVDSFQNLYISDLFNHRIRMIPKVTGTNYGILMTGGYIYTIAGLSPFTTGGTGTDGPALSSALNYPSGICVDSFQNLYISDNGNNRIRMIPKVTGIYYGISMTGGYIYTIAGQSPWTGGKGTDGNPLSSALNGPSKIFVDSSQNLYISESGNHRIRMIPNVSGTYYSIAMTANNIYTIAGQSPFTTGGTGADGNPLSSALNTPYGIWVDSFQNLYVADYNNHRIRMIPKVTGTNYGIAMTGEYIYTIAGQSPWTAGTGADGLPLSSALYGPSSISVDSFGNLYITDNGNSRIRMIPKVTGTYYTGSSNSNIFFNNNSGYYVNNTDAVYYNSLLYAITY